MQENLSSSDFSSSIVILNYPSRGMYHRHTVGDVRNEVVHFLLQYCSLSHSSSIIIQVTKS